MEIHYLPFAATPIQCIGHDANSTVTNSISSRTIVMAILVRIAVCWDSLVSSVFTRELIRQLRIARLTCSPFEKTIANNNMDSVYGFSTNNKPIQKWLCSSPTNLPQTALSTHAACGCLCVSSTMSDHQLNIQWECRIFYMSARVEFTHCEFFVDE